MLRVALLWVKSSVVWEGHCSLEIGSSLPRPGLVHHSASYSGLQQSNYRAALQDGRLAISTTPQKAVGCWHNLKHGVAATGLSPVAANSGVER